MSRLQTERALFQLLSISLVNMSPDDLPAYDAQTWLSLYKESKKQSIVGIVWSAVEKLPLQNQSLPLNIKMGWYGQVYLLEQRNITLDGACAKLTEKLESISFDSFVAKGQSLSQLYDEPLRRDCGDIDLFVFPRQSKFPRYDLKIEYIRRKIDSLGLKKLGYIVYHHAEWEFDHIPVEIHFRPSFLTNPWHNKKYQTWFERQVESRCWSKNRGYYSPVISFNLVYLLQHLFFHLLFEGSKLRQIYDYAILLKHLAKIPDADIIKAGACATIEEVGMGRFARGIMWVLQQTCGLPAAHLIMEPNKKLGEYLLHEIMESGFYGKTDTRNSQNRRMKRFIRRARLFHLFYSEIAWDIPFRLWHWWWRRTNQIKYHWPHLEK